MTARFTPAELQVIADIVCDANVGLASTRLREAFGSSTARMLEASVVADRLKAGQSVALGDGTSFGRLTEANDPVDLEQLVGQLAGLSSRVMADRLLAKAFSDLGCSPRLLGPAQRLLDKLRDEHGAGPARPAEPVAGGVWMVGDGLDQLSEAAPRALVDVVGCVRIGPLFIDPALDGLPPGILQAGRDLATRRPTALLLEGRVYLDLAGDRLAASRWLLSPRLAGRCLRHAALVTVGGHLVSGSAIEVTAANAADARVWWHEVGHALGQDSEADAERLGGLLHRAAERQA